MNYQYQNIYGANGQQSFGDVLANLPEETLRNIENFTGNKLVKYLASHGLGPAASIFRSGTDYIVGRELDRRAQGRMSPIQNDEWFRDYDTGEMGGQQPWYVGVGAEAGEGVDPIGDHVPDWFTNPLGQPVRRQSNRFDWGTGTRINARPYVTPAEDKKAIIPILTDKDK